MFGARFRGMTAKKSVGIIVKNRQARSRLAQQRVKVAPSATVHQIDDNFQPGLPDHRKVRQLFDPLEIGRLRIKGRAFKSPGNRPAKSPVSFLQPGHGGLDLPGHLWNRARPVMQRKLEPRILRRIMARGDIDPANRFALSNGQGEDRRRRVAVAEQRRQAICAQHFRRRQRRIPAPENGSHTRSTLRVCGHGWESGHRPVRVADIQPPPGWPGGQSQK